ncbi:MAG: GT4 family glycosyltransferase PelF [Candidatus Omnitrophota bacterium]
MNIMQILPELNVGGVESGTLDLSRHLVKAGHKAVVVSHGGGLVKNIEAVGAVHYTLPVHKKSFFSMMRMVPRLAEIIRKENIDIVHARSRVPAWIAYFACRRTRTVFITTCHGYYRRHPFSYVMGWGKRVIVLSNVIGRHMIDDFGVPHERIRFIPRSVDLQRFKYISPDAKRKQDFNVGIIGRITPLKGHLHFIKAMSRVARQIPRLRIWIVGDAPASKEAYREQVQVLVRRLGLWHCTEFLGIQRDIPAIMTQLDALVLATTTHEAFGRVIVEAQAAGVPVVATKVGGVVDIIEDNRTGFLVAPAEEEDMAEAVLKIYRDPGLAAGLAERAYRKIQEKYSVELMVKSTMDVYGEALDNFKALVMKFSSVGDVILSVPAIRALKKKFGRRYKISCLVGESSKDVLMRCPYLDELLVCDFKNRDLGAKGLLGLGRMLRKRNFDIAIDLQNNRRSHILAALSMSPDRYGYDNRKLGFLLNHRLKDSKALIEPVKHQFRVLNMLGIGLEDAYLELWPSEDDRRYIDEFLDSEWLSAKQALVGVNISASSRWLTKDWPLEHIARLCEELKEQDIRVVVTGTSGDIAQARALLGMTRDARPINACGKTTVNQLACLIKRCGAYISSDSAPLHVAAAVGTPFVALFGPTDPRRHLPPAENFIVIRKDLSCGPCYKSKCRRPKCMQLIRPEEVLEAVGRFLK